MKSGPDNHVPLEMNHSNKRMGDVTCAQYFS